MYLGLGVIIDGFSGFKPIMHKINNKKAQIRGFQPYSPEFYEFATRPKSRKKLYFSENTIER